MPSTLVLSDVGDETWGAVLEQGQTVELHVESSGRPGIAGNIYRGRVSRVLPGMQAAFIDIGIGKDAFLQVSDLPAFHPDEIDSEPDQADEGDEGDQEDGAARSSLEERARRDIELQSQAHQARGLPSEALVEEVPRGDPSGPVLPPRGAPAAAPIQDLLREGQELLVQVVKESIATKGARVTARIALPGRVLVFLPHTDRVFVSRRIVDTSERERLRDLAGQAALGQGGWIVRTAAEGASDTVIQRDAAYLTALWSDIREADRKGGAPLLIHPDLTVAERLLRDVISEEFDVVVVDSDRLRRVACDFLGRYLPRLGDRIRQVPSGTPLFDELGIHQEIVQALRSRLWLKGGGSIVVNPTEALVAIDVNTGKYVGREGLEETALHTNLEAVREIVRLLRLRDLGGIIVIDFIDMIESRNREILFKALCEELRKDRARSKLLAMSDFGLVQMTRKRTRRSLDRALQISCPSCGGSGRIRSAIALYYLIQRDLSRAAALAGPKGPIIRLHPAAMSRMEEEGLRPRLPGSSGPGDRERGVRLEPDPRLSEDRYEIVW